MEAGAARREAQIVAKRITVPGEDGAISEIPDDVHECCDTVHVLAQRPAKPRTTAGAILHGRPGANIRAKSASEHKQ
jgi:hypothetical protein